MRISDWSSDVCSSDLMFHAAAWGLPFAGAVAGVKFVFSAVNDAQMLCDLMNAEKVTHSAGVPPVLIAMCHHIDATRRPPAHLYLVPTSRTTPHRPLIAALSRLVVSDNHGWVG